MKFAWFNTHNGDSQWNERTGQRVEVLRELTEAEADIFDVGRMFHIRFEDGVETDAFIDELTVENEYEVSVAEREKLITLLTGKSLDTIADIEYVADFLLQNKLKFWW